MLALFRVILDIALLRSGPQVLPASTVLFALLVLVYLASGLLLASLIYADQGQVARITGFDLAYDLLAIGVVLGAARRAERYLQTASALFGTGALLNATLAPAVLLAVGGGEGFVPVVALVSLLVLGWALAIMAHVLRHALESDWTKAFVVATAYMFGGMLVRRLAEGG